MREPEGDKRLKWAFAISLLLHAAALGAAARIPAHVGTLTRDFDDIRVFHETSPPIVTTVDLVEWPLDGFPDTAIQLASAPALLTQPDPEPSAPRPETTAAADRPSAPARTPTRPVRAQPAAPSPPQSETPRASLVPEAPGDGRPAGGGGGGGGGFADLGSPSPNGNLAGPASGGTPAGELPGQGPGTGPGVGPGSGGGTGGGSGGGTGTGAGTGVGEGTGTGAGGGSGSGGTGDGGTGGFTSRVADRLEPVVLSKGVLDYPPAAAQDGVEGTVRLQVLVDEQGAVAEASVIASSGDTRLDAAALEFVRRWRYRPAVQDGQPRRVHTYATVRFELQ